MRDTIQNLFVKMIQNCHNLHPTDNVCFYLLCAFRHKLTDAFRSLRFTEHIEDCPDYFYFEADYVEDPFGEDVATRENVEIALGLNASKDVSHAPAAKLAVIEAFGGEKLLEERRIEEIDQTVAVPFSCQIARRRV